MDYTIKDVDLNKNKNMFVAINKKYISDCFFNYNNYYQKNKNIYYTGKQLYFVREKKIVTPEKRIDVYLLNNFRECPMDKFIEFLKTFDLEEVKEEDFIKTCFIENKFFYVSKGDLFNEEKLMTFDMITFKTQEADAEDISLFNKFYCMNFFAGATDILNILKRCKNIYRIYDIDGEYYDSIYLTSYSYRIKKTFDEKGIIFESTYNDLEEDKKKDDIAKIMRFTEIPNKEIKHNNNYGLIKLNDKTKVLEDNSFGCFIFESKEERINTRKTSLAYRLLRGRGENLLDVVELKDDKFLFIFVESKYIYSSGANLKILDLKNYKDEEINIYGNFNYDEEQILDNKGGHMRRNKDFSEVTFAFSYKDTTSIDNMKIYGNIDKMVTCYWIDDFKEFIFVLFKDKMYCISCNSRFSPFYQLENLYDEIENNFEEFYDEHSTSVIMNTLGGI